MKQSLFLLLAGSLFITCKNQQKASPDDSTTKVDSGLVITEDVSNTSDPLITCWANAFEEEGQDSTLIFRPCATHTFPEARYRNTFTLLENGEVEYSVMADNDAHTTERGKWSYDVQTKKLMISNMHNSLVHEFEVIEIGDNVLKVKK